MRRLLAAAAVLLVTQSATAAQRSARVEIRAAVDHGPWQRLLQRYVDERGLVDYAAWTASAADREELAAYLRALGAPADPPATGDDRQAALINAYNALTIAWMLGHYPTASIRSTPHPFDAPRHRVGGREVSLDDLEHGSLRPEFGFRIHAAISCASRSCPPLSRDAYTASAVSEQLDAAMRRWLAREDLNRFLPGSRRAEVSAVFRWNREDFERAGGLEKVLAEYAPEPARAFLARGGYAIAYRPYDWGLNDQGKEGRDYGGFKALWDKL